MNIHEVNEEIIIEDIKNRILLTGNQKHEQIQRDSISFQTKEVYDICDFTQYHDQEFVENVFRGVLKREPDQGGLQHYLGVLRSGEHTKTDILCVVRFCKEGRSKKVNILGIKKRCFLAVLHMIPIIGYALKSLFTLLTLPKLLKRIDEFEAHTHSKWDELLNNDLLLQNATKTKADIVQMETKAEYSQIEELRTSFGAGLETKVEYSQIEELRALLDSRLETKAEYSQVEELKTSFGAGLESKAEYSQIEELRALLDSRLETKAEYSQVEELKTSFGAGLESKAEYSQIEELRALLDSRLETKAEYSQVEEVIALLDSRLETKAEHSQIEELRALLDSRLETKEEYPQIEEFAEIPAENYLSRAIDLFGGPVKDVDKFDKTGLCYSLFENAFYDHNIVIEKQKIYLPYIQSHKNSKWLDMGCGRGEFIENLLDEGIKAVGVDINPVEIGKLGQRGFEVYCDDAVDFLKASGKTYQGISALQVIEHFDHTYLKAFIQLVYDKLTDDGLIVLETINPHNPLAFGNFHIDATHKVPLPPELMVFLLQWYGFHNVKIVYSAPLPEQLRSSDFRRNYHDYAVIGYKRRADV